MKNYNILCNNCIKQTPAGIPAEGNYSFSLDFSIGFSSDTWGESTVVHPRMKKIRKRIEHIINIIPATKLLFGGCALNSP